MLRAFRVLYLTHQLIVAQTQGISVEQRILPRNRQFLRGPREIQSEDSVDREASRLLQQEDPGDGGPAESLQTVQGPSCFASKHAVPAKQCGSGPTQFPSVMCRVSFRGGVD